MQQKTTVCNIPIDCKIINFPFINGQIRRLCTGSSSWLASCPFSILCLLSFLLHVTDEVILSNKMCEYAHMTTQMKFFPQIMSTIFHIRANERYQIGLPELEEAHLNYGMPPLEGVNEAHVPLFTPHIVIDHKHGKHLLHTSKEGKEANRSQDEELPELPQTDDPWRMAQKEKKITYLSLSEAADIGLYAMKVEKGKCFNFIAPSKLTHFFVRFSIFLNLFLKMVSKSHISDILD